MHVDIQPRRFDLVPGMPQAITITISNTGTVIAGYAVRVLGADPSWVTIEDAEVSLFPDESRTISVLIAVPSGMTAGERRLSVQVRELTPPEESLVEDIVFTVPEAAAVSLKADPLALTAGRTARLNLLVDNTGNTALHRRLHGQDPEGQVRFRFDPPIVRLAPGEHALVEVRASASQPFLGNPVIRPMELRLLDPDYVAPAPPEPTPEEKDDPAKLAAPKLKRTKRKKGQGPRIDDEAIPALANATFIQRPLVSRGPVSLLGLLIAVTVFALVITVALSRIVGQSAADRNLALEIAAARDAGSGVGTAGLAGRVTELTSSNGAPGVAVSVFGADDSENALVTTATAKDGTWKVGKLPAGDYKITFEGAGFQQMWYPQAIAADDAETVTLEPGKEQPGLDVALGGIPASIAGKIDGPDVSAATLTLKRPLFGMSTSTSTAGSVADAEQGATVMSVPIGDDGSFVLDNVPSPSVYDLVVEKPGFATSTQRVDVSAGEKRTGIEITLRQGDGVISGQVRSAAGPLGEATITATSGQLSVTTMSVNEGATASFTLRGLPTPATFTVVVSKDGYATQTITISLGEGQRLTGVDAALDSSSGRLDGQVLTHPDDDPAAGVLVSVTDGVQTVQTASTSPSDDKEGGLWAVTGLALPGEYTVTFSRPDLESQTIGVSLDAQGAVTAVGDGDGDGVGDQSEGGAGMITASLRSATAEVDALVLQRTARGTSSFRPLGEASVTLTSSTSSYAVTSASLPARDLGRYRIVGIPPGSYTLSIGRSGVAPVSRVVDLAAGEVWAESTRLEPPAMLSGTIKSTGSSEGVGAGWIVELYKYEDYPGTVYRSVRSTAGGRFTFSDIDAPQAYVVQVRRTASADPSGSATVSMLASDEKDITVRVRSDG